MLNTDISIELLLSRNGYYCPTLGDDGDKDVYFNITETAE